MLTTRARVSIPCVNKLRSVNKIGPGRAQRSGLGIYRIFGENVERVAALSWCAPRGGSTWPPHPLVVSLFCHIGRCRTQPEICTRLEESQ